MFGETAKTLCESLHLGKNRYNKEVLEEALSVDAADIDSISREVALKYLVVLSQYMFTLKFQDNYAKAAANDLKKAYDLRMVCKILSFSDLFPDRAKLSLKEKTAIILETDEEMIALHDKMRQSQIERDILENIASPIENYIQVLKRLAAPVTSE